MKIEEREMRFMKGLSDYGVIRKIRDFELRNGSNQDRDIFPIPSASEEYLEEFRNEEGEFDIDKIKERLKKVILKEFEDRDVSLFKPNEIFSLEISYIKKEKFVSIAPTNYIMNHVILVVNSLLTMLNSKTHLFRKRDLFICHILSELHTEVLLEVFKELNINIKEVE